MQHPYHDIAGGAEYKAMETSTPRVTGALANFVAERQFHDLGLDTIAVAKQCILDMFGVAIAGRNAPAVEKLLSIELRSGESGSATVICDRRSVSSRQAAL